RINMASNEVYAREGEYLPRLSAGGAAETEKVGEYTREGAVEEQLNIKEDKEFPDPLANLKLGLNASWEIDVWHKLRDASKVASLEYLASVESKNFFVTQLVSEVARTYYELLALDNKLENLDSTISLQRNVIHTINALKEYGRASSLPVARFNAEVKKNESERYLIEQEILEKENTLNLLLGRTPQPIQRDSNVLLSAELKSPQVGVPSTLLDNRPDIKQAALTLQAAELNIDVAKANFYPSFELKAGLGLSAFDSRYLFNVPESLAYSLSGDVFAPLINRRAIEAVYQNASAEQIEAAYEYELTILTAVAEVTNSLSKLDNLEKSAEARRHQIASLEQSIDIANRLFSSAHGEYLEVLLAQREALEARSEFIETRQQQMAALVDLYQALGGGWQS
ncbi:MAG TPA: RND transporter, partial [Alteromonas macleodii]|nr:RND transporter [Alteromonas macleodii]